MATDAMSSLLCDDRQWRKRPGGGGAKASPRSKNPGVLLNYCTALKKVR
jgi:hypothetical protein